MSNCVACGAIIFDGSNIACERCRQVWRDVFNLPDKKKGEKECILRSSDSDQPKK